MMTLRRPVGRAAATLAAAVLALLAVQLAAGLVAARLLTADEGVDRAALRRGADLVVADCFVSMGDSDHDERMAALMPYQVNAPLMSLASKDAAFMHCLAHVGADKERVGAKVAGHLRRDVIADAHRQRVADFHVLQFWGMSDQRLDQHPWHAAIAGEEDAVARLDRSNGFIRRRDTALIGSHPGHLVSPARHSKPRPMAR